MNLTRTLFLLPLVLAACSSAPKTVESSASNLPGDAPAWARNPYANYPDNRYLVAVGTGLNRNTAIDDAKKQLAESFVVKVRSETVRKTQSHLDQATTGVLVGNTSDESDKNLSLSTETFLRGAEVKETAEASNEVYALVAVDKLKARSGLLLEAQKAQAKLNPLMESLETKFTQEKYNQTKKAMSDLEQLFGEASALGMSALIDVAPYEARLTRIESSMRSRNEKWIFAVKTAKGAEFFERDLESCINDRGGAVYLNEQTPTNANRVEISVIERPQHQVIDGWSRIRFDVTAAIVQNDGRKYRINTSKTETGRTREAILESVSDQLSLDLCDRLFARMSEAGTTSVKPE